MYQVLKIILLLSNFIFNTNAETALDIVELIANITTLLESYAVTADYEFTVADYLLYYSGLQNEDIRLNITQLATKYNYPSEEHTVVTDDGYILKLVRIPKEGRPVVFIMHGILSSADDFVTVGAEIALPYLLYNEGYDVWLGNARGNKYSRNHTTISPDSAEFWNYTFNEIGLYDLPAMIEYALNVSNQESLVYIGHSQGTSAFFAMCSELACNKTISLMIALAPVAWIDHLVSPILRALIPFGNEIYALTQLIGVNEFLPSDPFMTVITDTLCASVALSTALCSNIYFTLIGFDYGQMNITNLPVLYGHIPAGTSSKSLIHYLQLAKSGNFTKFDYGQNNYEIYGDSEPAAYDLSKVVVPVAMYYGNNDWLAVTEDVKKLENALPNLINVTMVADDDFNHMDFLWAKDVQSLLYDSVLQLIKNYTSTS